MQSALRNAILALACIQLVSGFMFTPKKASLLSFDSESAKNRPVSKVITLLKDMLKQLEKESEEDQDIFDKMNCWCKTNEKKKTKVVADEQEKATNLDHKIGALTAESSNLNAEIGNLNKEVKDDETSMDKAAGIRGKEAKEFNAEEKDSLQSIAALKAAIIVLEKKSNSMLQVTKAQKQSVVATLRHILSTNSDLLNGVLTSSDRRTIGTFIQSSSSVAAPGGEILGVLKQMKETFEKNLASSQKEETGDQKGFAETKSAKAAQIKEGGAMLSKKDGELATTDNKNALAKQDLEDTTDAEAQDSEFLAALKEKCSLLDKEFEERQKTRQLEMEAVSKALAVLSSDDAHDLFTKTFNPSLLQTESHAVSDRRTKAASLLKALATKHNQPRLSSLALRVQLDAFTKVKQAINEMVTQLKQEQADEIKKKDFCVEEFNKNEMETEKKTRTNSDLLANIEDLEMTLKGVTADIVGLKADIEDLQVQLKRAGEDREKQNKEFQETVADQRATQKLLAQASRVLKGFYDKKMEAAAFVQDSHNVQFAAPPPAGFKTYKKSGGAGGVMGMLQEIMNDAKTMEAEAVHDEEDGQKTYEEFVKDTNLSIEKKNKEIVNKSKHKAKTEGALVSAKEDQENVMLELEQLSNYKAELHSSCDFITKNFEIRQTARDEEIEALKQALAILSGSKFTGFLQQLSQE